MILPETSTLHTPNAGVLALNRTKLNYVFEDTNVGQTVTQVFTLSNTGTAPLTFGSPFSANTDSVDFTVGTASGSSGCTPNQVIAAGSNCTLLATFQPQSIAALKDTVTFPSNSANAASALLSGGGVKKTVSVTSIAYSDPPAGLPLAGQPFSVTATVTPVGATGTVSFTIDNGITKTATLATLNGVTSATVMFTAPAGSQALIAQYAGDATYVASMAALNVNAVSPATTTTTLAVTSTGLPQVGSPFTLTATVTSPTSQA